MSFCMLNSQFEFFMIIDHFAAFVLWNKGYNNAISTYRSSRPQVFLGKGVLKYAAILQENTKTEV